MADKETEQKEDFNPRKLGGSIKPIATKKTPPSLSDYNSTTELMPMREKEILSRKDQKAKQLVVNSARSNDAQLDMGYSKLFNYGKTINPSKPAEKKDTTGDAIKAMQSSDISVSTKGLSDLKGEAPQQELPKQDSKQLMEDARLQRRAKTKDAIAAFFTGVGGSKYDWENSQSNQLQNKRDEQFKEYKDIVQNNQKVKAAWDAKKNDEVLAHVLKQKDEAKNEPERLKRLEIQEQQLLNARQAHDINREQADLQKEEFKAREAGGYYNYKNRSGGSSGGGSDSYDDIVLDPTQERVINEITRIGGDTSAGYSKRMRTSIINHLYEKKIDDKGNVTLSLRAGADAVFKNLSAKTKEISVTRAEITRLQKRIETAGFNADPADKTRLAQLEAKLPTLQDELDQVLQTPSSGSVQTQGTQSGKSALDDILNKTK